MHELSVCLSVVDQLARLAAANGATAVTRVVLRIGPLSGVEPELVAHAFPIAIAGSIAEGAVLEVERTPIRVRCAECGVEAERTASDLSCPACGAWRTELVSGDEMILRTVELAVEEADHV